MTTLTVAEPVVVLRSGIPAAAAELGGKAASLDRLVQAGFPVPPTAVVIATAYRGVAAHSGLAGLLSRLRAGAVVPAAVVDTAFLAVSIDTSLEWSLIDAAREVGAATRSPSARPPRWRTWPGRPSPGSTAPPWTSRRTRSCTPSG